MFCRNSELRLNQKAWKTIFLRVFLILKPSRLFLKHSRFELKPSRWNLSSSYLFKNAAKRVCSAAVYLGIGHASLHFLFYDVVLLERWLPIRFFVCISASNRNVEFGIWTDVWKSIITQAWRSFGLARNFCQACALIERVASDAGHGLRDGDARQTCAISVFASRFISIIYTLKGRKVLMWILWLIKRTYI